LRLGAGWNCERKAGPQAPALLALDVRAQPGAHRLERQLRALLGRSPDGVVVHLHLRPPPRLPAPVDATPADVGGRERLEARAVLGLLAPRPVAPLEGRLLL